MISSLVRLASAVVAITVMAGHVTSAQEVDVSENLAIALERTRCFGTRKRHARRANQACGGLCRRAGGASCAGA